MYPRSFDHTIRRKKLLKCTSYLVLGCKRVERAPRTPWFALLDLKQNVLFASQEADSDLKYGLKLVQCMFLHSLLTGLRSDCIKLQLKPCLKNTHVTDRWGTVWKTKWSCQQQKLGSLNGLAPSTNPVPHVAQVTSTKDTPTGGTQTIHRSKQNPTFLQKYRKWKQSLLPLGSP